MKWILPELPVPSPASLSFASSFGQLLARVPQALPLLPLLLSLSPA
jgi:hypothetical protein